MPSFFRHLRRSAPGSADTADDSARRSRESRRTAENDARGQASEHAARIQVDANETRRQVADADARRQADANETRRQIADAEARRQAAQNEALYRSQESTRDGGGANGT